LSDTAKKHPERSEDEQIPGFPLDTFTQAIDVVAQLRDQGDLVIFFTRSRAVRLIGHLAKFRSKFSSVSKTGEISKEDAESVLEEMQQYLSAYAHSMDMPGALRLLRYAPMNSTYGGELKGAARAAVEKKLTRSVERLFTDTLRRRVKRLQESRGLCFEDFDSGITYLRGKDDGRLSEPFLRVRIRRSPPSRHEFPFFFWPPGTTDAAPSVEFDCDESDIDVLIHRLLAAKESLVDAKRTAPDTPKESVR
jgi:hypothetical protein